MELKIQNQSNKCVTSQSSSDCPFYNRPQAECRAAAQLHKPDRLCILIYCRSEDYDDCPLFLCRALRSSEIKGRMHDPELLNGK
jgi:hypothetical protein